MTRLEQEWALVPVAARWIAVLVALAMTGLLASVFLLPLLAHRGHPGAPAFFVVAMFLLSLIGPVTMGVYTLLVGYVFGDARRRGMSHVLWTLLAVFIPSGVGLILYFILREPIPVPCPSCGAPARKGHAYCARCGAAVRAACPQCQQPVEAAWKNCVRCGAPLAEGSAGPPASGAGA